MTRLNLASGTDIKSGDGWVNLDIVAWPKAVRPPDVIWDARSGKIPYPDNSVEEIKAGYLFLHLAKRYHDPLIREMFRVLQPGGLLMIDETDMERVMPRWIADPDNRGLYESIWGEHGDGEPGAGHGLEFEEFDTHKHGWTEKKLTGYLQHNGFVNIRRVKFHHESVWWDLTVLSNKP